MLNMSTLESRSFGTLYVEELFIGKGTFASLNSPFMTEGQLNDVAIVGGVIDSVAIGMTTPAPAAFTDITSGKDGDGQFNVKFYGKNSGDYMQWSGIDSQLTVNGKMTVREGINMGNISINRNTVLGTTGIVQLAVPGQSLSDSVLKPGYLQFSGPISQQNASGSVSFYSHAQDFPSGVFLGSATDIGIYSAGKTRLKSKYSDICLTAASVPQFDVTSAEKVTISDDQGSYTRLQLHTGTSSYALEGISDGDLVEFSSTDTLPELSGVYTVYNVNARTGIFQIAWNGGVPVHSATSSTTAVCSFKKASGIGGRVVLDVSKSVTIPSTKPLYLDGDGGNVFLVNSEENLLSIHGQTGIRLATETGVINVPTNIPLTFGTDNQYIISSGPDLDLSSTDIIHLTPGTSVTMPSGKSFVFGQTTEYIVGNSNLTINSSAGQISIQAKTNVAVSAQLGNITLSPGGNVRITSNTPLILGSSSVINPATVIYDENLSCLNVTCTGKPVNLTCSKVQLIDNAPVVFGSNSPSQFGGEIRSDAVNSIFKVKVLPAQIAGGGVPTLMLDAPVTIVTGDFTVMGQHTEIKSTIKTVADPVIQLGAQLNNLEVKDRGVSFLYGLDKVGFFGYKQTTGKFTFIPDCTTYSNDVFTGPVGSMDVGELAVGSMSGDPDLILNAKTGYIRMNAPMGAVLGLSTALYFGSDRASYISAQSAPATLTISSANVLITFGTLQLTNSGPRLTGTADGILQIISNEIRLGTGPSNGPTIAIVPDTFNANLPAGLSFKNLNSLTLPPSTVFKMGTSASFMSNSENTIVDTSVPLRVQLNDNPMYINGEIRQAVWAGATVTLGVGGTNRTSWTHGCIPYVDKTVPSGGAFAETAALSWDSPTRTLNLDGSSYSSRAITAGDGIDVFSVAGMIHAYASPKTVQIGPSPTTDSIPVAVDLRVLGRSWFSSRIHVSSGTETIHRTTSVFNPTYGDLNLSASGCILLRAPYGIGTGNSDETLLINNSIALQAQGTYSWSGYPSESIALISSTHTVVVNSSGDIKLNSPGNVLLNDACGLTWAKAEMGANAPRIVNEGQTLHIQSAKISFEDSSSLEFSDNRKISSTASGFFIQDSDTIYVQAPTIHFDGNVIMQGKTIFTSSPSISLDPAIIALGGGSSTAISSIANANDGHVRVQVIAPHGLAEGDAVTISMSNSQPDIDGIYHVSAVIDNQTIEVVTTFSALTVTGNSGYLTTVWKTDPGKDSGLQINYYNATAFMGLQHSSGRFVLASSGTNKSEIFQVDVYGDLQIRSLFVDTISGFTLSGPLDAGSRLISGSNFRSTGGSFTNVSVDNWTTETTTVVSNLNADRVRGLEPSSFVLVDGSQPLTANWNAGSDKVITCANVGLGALASNGIPYVSSDKTLATAPGFYFIPNTGTLVSNVDVSNKTLTLSTGQIPGSKIGTGKAACDISGNAETTTNAVYTTDYDKNFSILVANSANEIESLEVPMGCMIGRIDNDPTGKLTAIPLPTFTLPSTRVSLIAGSTTEISVAYNITYINVVSSPGSPQLGANGTLGSATEDGITRIIYVRLEQGTTFTLTLTFSSADGTTGLKNLFFDRSGQSVYLGFDMMIGCWWAIESGATLL